MIGNVGIFVKNLDVEFNGNKVLHNVNLQAEKGEKISLSGPSGAGKTTLLNVLLGFQPANNGEVEILGKDVLINPYASRMSTSFVPQDFNLPVDDCRELLLFPFVFKRNVSLLPNDKKILEVMNAMGLENDILSAKVSEISGGQKQRLVLSSAILLNKPVMVLDEPFSALDEKTVDMVIGYLLALEDTTIIASTHNKMWSKRSGLQLKLELLSKTSFHG